MSSRHHERRTRFPTAELTNLSGRSARVELSDHGPPLFVDHAFDFLEVQLGAEDGIPRLEIISALEWPQLHSRYVITQPEVLDEDIRRGWVPIGGTYPDRVFVSPATTQHFELRTPDGRADPELLIHLRHECLALTVCQGTAVARLAEVDHVATKHLETAA